MKKEISSCARDDLFDSNQMLQKYPTKPVLHFLIHLLVSY